MDRISPRNQMLARLMDVATLRHKVIANNVANVNTPAYRQRAVAFEDAFNRAVDRGQLVAALRVAPRIVEGEGGAERADGNNVDVDQEVGALNKNSLLFRTYAQILASYLATQRTAITGR
jgi:flagellar basal-body rod protein FlgB